MSRTHGDVSPREPVRNQPDFNPQQYDVGAQRIERGIAMGVGSQALHEELNLIREAAMQNGHFNVAQYRGDVKAIDQKLHADGFLPHVHIDVDGQGHDIVRRDGGSDSGAAPQEHHGRRGRGHHGHGAGRHHGRGRGRSSDAGDGNDGDHESVASGDSLQETEMRPNDSAQSPYGFDRSSPRPNAGDPTTDPSRDRSKVSNDHSQIWGSPTISAAKIDQVLRDNHSPAAGMGSYIYDQATARGINPAFALAMYGQESTFGTKGAGARNNSFGNIRAGSHGFKHYDSVKEGIDDWMRLMSSDAYHGKSLNAVIHKYAPGSDGNNPHSYQAYVSNNMAKWARSTDGDSMGNQRYA